MTGFIGRYPQEIDPAGRMNSILGAVIFKVKIGMKRNPAYRAAGKGVEGSGKGFGAEGV